MERKCHVTASTFGKIIKRKDPPTNEFVKSIGNPRNRRNLPYVKYGTENEGGVADLYVNKMHEEGNTGNAVTSIRPKRQLSPSAFRGISLLRKAK